MNSTKKMVLPKGKAITARKVCAQKRAYFSSTYMSFHLSSTCLLTLCPLPEMLNLLSPHSQGLPILQAQVKFPLHRKLLKATVECNLPPSHRILLLLPLFFYLALPTWANPLSYILSRLFRHHTVTSERHDLILCLYIRCQLSQPIFKWVNLNSPFDQVLKFMITAIARLTASTVTHTLRTGAHVNLLRALGAANVTPSGFGNDLSQ